MRKLILQMQTSLDLFVASKNGDTSWMVWSWGDDWSWDDKLRQYHIDTTASADCILLSSHMAREGFIDHWARMAQRTDNPQAAFAKNITAAHKVVFGKSAQGVLFANSSIADGSLGDTVRDLKKLNGKNLIAFGGAGFAASLVAEGLVDEFHFIVNPVVLRDGLSIFSKNKSPQHLRLIDTKPYECGVVVARYSSR